METQGSTSLVTGGGQHIVGNEMLDDEVIRLGEAIRRADR
jgi:hypothetical protein